MQKILVPTDFSRCADDASKTAIRLAKVFGAQIFLYHCASLPPDWDILTNDEKQQYPAVLNDIAALEAKLNTRSNWAEEQQLRAYAAYGGGSLVTNIQAFAEARNIDFIVMGSHGVSGDNQYMLGSNTQKVVRMIHRPVLIVKKDTGPLHFDKVIYASSFDQKEKADFRYFLNFLKPFQPEIHLLAINTGGFFKQPSIIMHSAMEDFAEMASPIPCHTHFYRDFKVDHGIRQFVREIHANLVAISNRSRRPLKRIFLGSNVEALVNQAKIPVLSIDFAE